MPVVHLHHVFHHAKGVHTKDHALRMNLYSDYHKVVLDKDLMYHFFYHIDKLIDVMLTS